jgi:predicted GNAT family N-acyltransferase
MNSKYTQYNKSTLREPTIKPQIHKINYTKRTEKFLQNNLFEFMIKYFGEHYPNITEWYFNKVLPDVRESLRSIYVIKRSDEILGVAIIRKSVSKYHTKNPKICSFYICDEIRNQGLGNKLFKKCINELNVSKKSIIITVPEEKLFGKYTRKCFNDFLKKHGFKKVDEVGGKYRTGKIEHIFKKQ